VKKTLENTIFSLTSYPARINTVHITIQSLLDQTVRAEKLILWLCNEDFHEKEGSLPEDLLSLTTRGLTIDWCEDLKSYKKLIPALIKYPSKIIITFDDDILYNKEIAETLYNCHMKYPDDIITHRVSRMFFSEENELDLFPRPMYYDQDSVTLTYYASLKKPSFFNKLSSGIGTLYPLGSLHKDILNKSKYTSLAPTNDDLWFWLQGVRNKTKVRVPERHFPVFQDIPGSQNTALNYINNLGGDLFSRQLKNIMTAYPEIKEILQSGNSENLEIIDTIINNSRHPLISIVCFTHNHKPFIRRCLDGIIDQRIKVPLEIIIIDNASTDGTVDILREYEKKYPRKIKVVYQGKKQNSRYAPIISLHILSIILGKYIAFCEGNNYWIDLHKLQKQFVFMERHPDFSLASSGFSEDNNGIITNKIIKCDDRDGFEYNNIDNRGYSHLQTSTILCRKRCLESIVKNCSKYKYWDTIHQNYFLLMAGPGRYFSENFTVHNITADNTSKNISDKGEIVYSYRVFRELCKKTKDKEISKLYFRYLRLLLDNRLYRNKIEKTRILIEKHTKDRQSVNIAIKKMIKMIVTKFSLSKD
jgi:glycosyltransferase involved in cell wall biosynthesis